MTDIDFHELLPDPEALLALEPEELAGVVIQYLNSLPDSGHGHLNRYNFSLPHTVAAYQAKYRDELSRALMEAWVYLEREGLVAPVPGATNEWVFITRRGKRMLRPEDLASYRRGSLLPRQLLHPRIGQKVWATFLRGDYDTAIFQAFKEVEVRVREVGKYGLTKLGVDLMREAFDPNSGPLTEMMQPKPEREALAHLFAGAIGLYKNPGSHRNVTIDAPEAVELIVLASHLLNIVDRCSQRIGTRGAKP